MRAPIVELVAATPAMASRLAAIDSAVGATGWSVNALTDELGRDGRVYLAARVGDEVVGFGGLAWQAGEAHVMALAVLPEWQGRGIGRALLETLIDAAAGAPMTLEVRATDERTRRLYRRAGFAEAGTRPGYYADGGDAVIAWRR